MGYFAEIDNDNKVLRVLKACNVDIQNNGGDKSEQAAKHFEKTSPLSINGVKWVQTSYNKNFRKNYAGIGSIYDPFKDEFISVKPYPSWILNSNNDWESTVSYPSITTYADGIEYKFIDWDEENLRWVAYDHNDPHNKFEWSPTSSSWISII